MEFDFFDFFALLPELHVQKFDRHGKAHGKIDITFWNMLSESLRHEHGADENEETQREHFYGRMPVHKGTDLIHKDQHDNHRQDYRGNHHADLFHHSDRGDDGVE